MKKIKEEIKEPVLEEFNIHKVVYANQGLILEFNYDSNKGAELLYERLKEAQQRRLNVEITDKVTGLKFIAMQNAQITRRHIIEKLEKKPIYNAEFTWSYLQALIN